MRIKEKRWTIWFAIVLMVITSLPYYWGFETQNNDRLDKKWVFSGFVFGVEDGNSYIAKMRLGYDGAWLFRTPYTSMNQSGIIAFLPYMVLGKLAGTPAVHEQLILLFHWFRILAGILMIIATHDFLSMFVTDRFLQQLGLVMISIGGGLGWIFLFNSANKILPLEFYSPEGFGFLSLYGLPHLALGRAFFLWTITEYLNMWDAESSTNKIVAWKLSVFWLLAGIAQPIYPGLLGIIMITHWGFFSIVNISALKNKQSKEYWLVLQKLVIAGILPGIFLGYTVYKFLMDPYLRIWSIQNYLPSAPLRYYLASYGWLILIGIFGLWELWKKNRSQCVLMFIWVFIVPMLIFIPISVQRRLIEGYWVILVCAGMVFISKAPYLGSKRSRYLITLILFLLSLPSSVFLLYGGIRQSLSPEEPVYFPHDKVRIFHEIERHLTKERPIVLASYSTSNALPAYASVNVLIGHGPESAYGDKLLSEIKKFYSTNGTDEFRIQFLSANSIRFVIWSDSERAYGDWNPETADYLQLLYSDNDTNLYEVILEELSD